MSADNPNLSSGCHLDHLTNIGLITSLDISFYLSGCYIYDCPFWVTIMSVIILVDRTSLSMPVLCLQNIYLLSYDLYMKVNLNISIKVGKIYPT